MLASVVWDLGMNSKIRLTVRHAIWVPCAEFLVLFSRRLRASPRAKAKNDMSCGGRRSALLDDLAAASAPASLLETEQLVIAGRRQAGPVEIS